MTSERGGQQREKKEETAKRSARCTRSHAATDGPGGGQGGEGRGCWTDSLLGELSGLLVLRVSEQLHNSLLVGRESGNLGTSQHNTNRRKQGDYDEVSSRSNGMCELLLPSAPFVPLPFELPSRAQHKIKGSPSRDKVLLLRRLFPTVSDACQQDDCVWLWD